MEQLLQQISIWVAPLSAIVTIGTLVVYFTALKTMLADKRQGAIDAEVNKQLEKRISDKLEEYGIVEKNTKEHDSYRQFNDDPSHGLPDMFEYYSTNALPWIGYNRIVNNENNDAIIYDERLSNKDNKRFLKNLKETSPKDLYCKQITEFEDVISKINDELSILQQGVLERTIFDLEHGGIFYYKLSQHEYLYSTPS